MKENRLGRSDAGMSAIVDTINSGRPDDSLHQTSRAPLIELQGVTKVFGEGQAAMQALAGIVLARQVISWRSWATAARASPPAEHPRLSGFANGGSYRNQGVEVCY
jgi:hypothetical protein